MMNIFIPAKHNFRKLSRARIGTVMFLTLASATFSSCDGVPEADSEPQLVVEGWISSGGPAIVLLSYTMSEEGSVSLMDKVVEWGKVTVSDGESTEILRGGLVPGWLPPYRYYSLDMRGEPGKTYRVDATYDGKHASASAYMPLPTRIEELLVREIPGNDTLRDVSMVITVPQDTPAYYYLTLSKAGPRQQPLPCFLGAFSSTTPGERMEIGIFAPKRIDQKHHDSALRVGEDYEVSLNRVSPEVYSFWKAYCDVSSLGHNPFFSRPGNLPTNITGGYGVWSAQGSSSRYFEVR